LAWSAKLRKSPEREQARDPLHHLEVLLGVVLAARLVGPDHGEDDVHHIAVDSAPLDARLVHR
jgi:hypothetical protein